MEEIIFGGGQSHLYVSSQWRNPRPFCYPIKAAAAHKRLERAQSQFSCCISYDVYDNIKKTEKLQKKTTSPFVIIETHAIFRS
jgi:hypothetical protein